MPSLLPLRAAPQRCSGAFGLRRLFLTLTSAALLACGGGGTASAPLTAQPEPLKLSAAAPGRWVVLGSSTAAGGGAPAGAGWVARLAAQWREQGVSVDNLARGLLLSSQALPVGTLLPEASALPDPAVNVDAALARTPTLVLLSFPTNDALAGVPAADTVAAWRTIRDLAAAAGVATVVLGTQPRSGLNRRQNASLRATDELASTAFGPCFVPLREALAGPDGAPALAYSAGDGTHLNAEGHALIHERVAAVLATDLCVRAVLRPAS
jgi:lysophospholipase L1-like esterase